MELELINRALARVGASPINALDEDTELAEKAAAVWPDVRDTCLALNAWSFGRKTFALGRRTAVPANGWKYGFDLPGGRLGGPEAVQWSVDPRDVLRDYAIEEDIIFANRTALWARFRISAAIGMWPPEFRLAVTTALAAQLAVPVAQDQDLAERLGQQAYGSADERMRGGLMAQAIALDLARAPIASPLLAADPLTAARYG